MPEDRGAFITFEGGEGSGKSTQIAMLPSVLTDWEISFICVREPGATVIGEEIRRILLDPDLGLANQRAELLLFNAARAIFVDEVVEPALARGISVVADRFFDSTTAYQAFGRGIDLEFDTIARHFATNGLSPDLTIYLDLDPEIGVARATHGGADRMEREALEFHQRVREGYRWIAEREPNRFVVVDASGTPEEVSVKILTIVSTLFAEREKGA